MGVRDGMYCSSMDQQNLRRFPVRIIHVTTHSHVTFFFPGLAEKTAI